MLNSSSLIKSFFLFRLLEDWVLHFFTRLKFSNQSGRHGKIGGVILSFQLEITIKVSFEATTLDAR